MRRPASFAIAVVIYLACAFQRHLIGRQRPAFDGLGIRGVLGSLWRGMNIHGMDTADRRDHDEVIGGKSETFSCTLSRANTTVIVTNANRKSMPSQSSGDGLALRS